MTQCFEGSGWTLGLQQVFGQRVDSVLPNEGLVALDPPTRFQWEKIDAAAGYRIQIYDAADAKGLASGPMIGFDAAGVQKAFNIPERYVPVMTLAVGYAKEASNWPRKPRLAVAETLAFDEGKVF